MSDSTKREEERWRWPRLAGLVGLLTVAALVATTIASIYGAIYTINPDLKPREKLGATIDHIAVEHAVDYIGYRYRMGESNPTLPADFSPFAGDMVFIHVSLLGFKDRSYSRDPILVDERGVQLPPREARTGVTTGTCEDLSPKADEDGITWRCWAATPTPGTKYRIRIELYDAGRTADITPGEILGYRTMLDFKESDLFTAVDH